MILRKNAPYDGAFFLFLVLLYFKYKELYEPLTYFRFLLRSVASCLQMNMLLTESTFSSRSFCQKGLTSLVSIKYVRFFFGLSTFYWVKLQFWLFDVWIIQTYVNLQFILFSLLTGISSIFRIPPICLKSPKNELF